MLNLTAEQYTRLLPSVTDGSLRDMIYLHSYKNLGLTIDIVSDIRRINDISLQAKRAGMINLGGGVCKHQIANAMLFVHSRLALIANSELFADRLHQFSLDTIGAAQ
jgi:deoxyhypusine synthase